MRKIFIMISLLVLMFMTSCNSEKKPLNPGLYLSKDHEYVRLEVNNRAMVSKSIAMSIAYMGEYSFEGENLIIKMYPDKDGNFATYKFSIKDEKSFVLSEIENTGNPMNFFDVDTEFVLEKMSDIKDEDENPEGEDSKNADSTKIAVNKSGMTIEDRYPVPKGYKRVVTDEFGDYLRKRPLKAYGEKVQYFNGKEKSSWGVYDSVFDVDIGDRDLHQCADAIMLLRAEYFYGQKKYEDIKFHFVNGFLFEYSKWLGGYRLSVEGNKTSYVKSADYDDSYETFRKYMDMVMAYASTLSLEKELFLVNEADMRIGDVFIKGGSPGHAIIVVDMAENELGEKLFMLAQSYMPAQQTHILKNPNNQDLLVWYELEEGQEVKTPEWTFKPGMLRSFTEGV